ncbi:Na+/Pi symporter [Rhizophlyctis rosea]|uniref:Phosphate transporter n=1 Tax=Rhizophlyctis rosea TaxID=64517 RepID=A0AAD5SBT8_9FUNG|nr:Na+/Pi symporter [Rhizophlyctis rosea]
MDPYSYTWLFAIGLVLAFADAFGIGSNDVANSFATSVGSRSLTFKQAVGIAVFTEFGGAVLLGAGVADTIKNKIISINQFADAPEALMLAFVCALFGSAIWVNAASHYGWPVSTTHSITGAIAGAGVAAFGINTVEWSWKGMGQIAASWFISPIVAGIFAAIIYSFTKYGIMRAKNSLKRALMTIPVYIFFTLFLCIMYIILKGGQSKTLANKVNMIAGIAAGVAGAVAIWAFIFYVPWIRRKVQDEENLRWYHVFYTPFVPVQEKDAGYAERLDNLYKEHGKAFVVKEGQQPAEGEKEGEASVVSVDKTSDVTITEEPAHATASLAKLDEKPARTYNPFVIVKNIFNDNLNRDVVSLQSQHVADIHARAVRYESKTEHLYSFTQILTASFASFAHGSNDVSNAVGPLAAIYAIWESGVLPKSSVPVPIWILVLGGIAIDFGLIFVGWRIMQKLGNNLTYHTPSRGFSMEFGAALTVISASYMQLPVSTTHCITGATVGVGLCNGNLKAVNWRMIAWCFFGWILTVPCAGVIAGCMFALLSRAPKIL